MESIEPCLQAEKMMERLRREARNMSRQGAAGGPGCAERAVLEATGCDGLGCEGGCFCDG